MRNQSVFLLIVLVAVSMVNAFEFTSFAEVKELRSTQYGNNLIETISLALDNNGGKIDEIKQLLNDLLFQLNKDQKDADEAWEKESKRLEALIADLKERIVKLKAEISELEADQAVYEAKRDQAIANLEQYQTQLARNIQALAELKEKREKDEAEFKQSQSDHTDVINAIDAVVEELNKLIGSVSGKGKYDHIQENAAEQRDSLKKSFLQVTRDEQEANLFVQMATQADQDALRKLIDLLINVRDSTRKSLNDDVQHEKESLETYTKLVESLEADNKNLADNIEVQTKNRDTYIKRVEDDKAKIASLTKLLQETLAELEQTEKEPASKKAQYLADKAERDSERTVINRLIGIVQRKLENMSKFLRSNTGGY